MINDLPFFQYRMCAGIMELSNALIYGNRLRCGSPDIANAKIKISCAEPLTSWLKEVETFYLHAVVCHLV